MHFVNWGGHSTPHAPQWESSLRRSTHAPPQSLLGDWQEAAGLQAPVIQASPLWQAFPQPPQWLTSASTSTQLPLQSVKVLRHAQVLELHWSPAEVSHLVPHEPQFLLS
jgi:hypothetical protein